MASFNRVILVGNCTRDVEIRYTQGGMAVCEIGLAVNEKRKSAAGEWVDDVVFVDVVFFGKTAEVCGEYVSKGSQILVEGRLKQESWEDKQTGQKRSKLKVTGDKLVLLGQKPRDGSPPQGGRQASAPAQGGQTSHNDAPPRQQAAEGPEDNLPF